MAYQSGFIKREAKKIEAPYFVANMCLTAQKGSPSYNDLAAKYQTLYKTTATKQAFWKKVTPACVLFFQMMLARIIQIKISALEWSILKVSGQYKRILVQDSTIIQLPFQLFETFSGVSNAHTQVCNARIQGVYDLISGNFVSFSIDPYSKNDLSAACQLDIQPGDLVLRDRGYSSFSEINRQIDLGVYFIFRHKFKNTYLDPDTGKPIDLRSILMEKGQLDITVCLNHARRPQVRLIALPVKQEMADIRRMKAKREMKGHNPPDELLFFMSWTIFITNLPQAQADPQRILALYRLRWRIEVVFKIWKTYMGFDKIHKVSENQLRCILLARFIMIIVCAYFIYHPYYWIIRKKHEKYLSMIKLINYLMFNTCMITTAMTALNPSCQNIKRVTEVFVRYCTYDLRKRPNYCQFFEEIILS